jgi:hypothetical protein
MIWRLSLRDQRRFIKLRNIYVIPQYIYKIVALITNKPNLALVT